jgi:hypothetical protein
MTRCYWLTSIGFTHLGSSRTLVKQACDVRFQLVIPSDLQKNPYILLSSWGIHTHAPPPPTKTPQSIRATLEALARKTDQSGLSVGKF